MTTSNDAALTLAVNLYQLAGGLTGTWVYLAGCVAFFVSAQWVPLIFWFALIGPLVGSFAGLLWPIYWLLMLTQWS